MPCVSQQLTGSPEGEVLRLLARVNPDERARARARELLPALEWATLRALARRHGVLPLLYRALAESFSDEVPEEALSELRLAFQQNARANLGRIRELKRLLRILAAAEIDVLVLKGPALAEMAYGDPGLRSYGDLDILVSPEALPEAVRLATENGYAPLWALTPDQERTMLRHGYHYNLRSTQDNTHLEVHWRMIDPCFAFALSEPAIWRRKVQLPLGSDPVQTLAPEDQLLFLCMHGAKHFWSSLSMVCDVAELVNRSPNLDWPKLQQIASNKGADRVLRLGLCLADELLDARPEPEFPASARADSAIIGLKASAISFLNMPKPEETPVTRLTAFHLRLFPSLASRIRYLRASLAPKELDVLTFRLPVALSPLYVLLRPLRLLLRLKPPATGG